MKHVHSGRRMAQRVVLVHVLGREPVARALTSCSSGSPAVSV